MNLTELEIVDEYPDRALWEEFEYLKIAAQDTEVTEVDCIIYFFSWKSWQGLLGMGMIF